MAEPSYGDLSLPQSVAEIRDDFLTDVRLEMVARGEALNDANLAVQPGTFTHIYATAVGSLSFVTRSAIAAGRANMTPLYCSGEVLEEWRVALGLPDISMSPSTGRIRLRVTGTATVPDGREFVLPNGLRGEVVGTWTGVTDEAEIGVKTIDVGDATQLDGGATVRFVNPPLNVATEATVSYASPLTGGADLESEDRKRTRVLNRLAFAMGGANWGYLRGLAFDALAQVQDCFVYPALGGPASVKIVPVRAMKADAGQFTRALDTVALDIVRQAIHAYSPDSCQYVVVAAADEAMDAAIQVALPNASQAGGDGSGWSDTLVWPPLAGSDTRVRVSAITTSMVVRLDASTTLEPIAGLTRIAWWSSASREFVVRTIIAVTGGTGAWDITVDRPLIDSRGSSIAVGDYVSPAATNIVQYGKSWMAVAGNLGAGENVTVYDNRRKRHPFISSGPKASLTITELMAIKEKHPEITDAGWSYRAPNSGTPTVPTYVVDPPNILVPRHFGIYPL